MKRLIVINFLIFSLLTAFSQTESPQKGIYENAKTAYQSGDYSGAIALFDQILVPSKENSYAGYARYFKAYSLVNLKKYSDARFVLVKLLDEISDWEKKDEAQYLLAYSQILESQVVEANTSVNQISDSGLKDKGHNMIYHFASKDVDLEKLKIAQQKLKSDKDLAFILAQRLKGNTDQTNQTLFKYLISEYDFSPEDFSTVTGKKKSTYTVVLLLPFSLNNPKAYLNTPNLNIKKGVEYAIDSLKKIGVKINLITFDTEREKGRIEQILAMPDLKKVDLILGPVSDESCQKVAKFCNDNKIVNFNFSRDDKSLTGEFVYTLRNSYQSTAKQLAVMAKQNFDTTKSAVIYFNKSTEKIDSILAYNYKKELEKLGIKVSQIKGFSKDMTSLRSSITAISDASTSHVVVFSGDNQLMPSSIMSAWESANKVCPLIVSKEWLDQQVIGYEQFVRKNVHFIYNDYIAANDRFVNEINQQYLDDYGVKPLNLNYLAMGYDVMLFCGTNIFKNGTHFHTKFATMTYQKLPLTSGVNLSKSKSNAVLPVLKLDENYQFIWVNQPK
jgi:ABC-type branched-subunit amino acid transport system substrate-binding protein